MEELFSVQDKASDYRYAGFGSVPKRKSYAIQAADLLAGSGTKTKRTNWKAGRDAKIAKAFCSYITTPVTLIAQV